MRRNNTCTTNHESGQAEGSSIGYLDTAQCSDKEALKSSLSHLRVCKEK